MRSNLSNILMVIGIIGITGLAVAEKEQDIHKSMVENSLEQRVRTSEDEIRRMKVHLSDLENLLEALILSTPKQPTPLILTNEDLNGMIEKRSGGGWAFMGSRGKRKQPFILGSRGKRAIENYESGESDDLDLEKRKAYFYGSRGKKQFLSSLDDESRIPPYTSKRYTFMGSRGKK